MDFRTEIKPLHLNGLIHHGAPLFLMGSCFTDHMGAKLDEELFTVIANPFGTVYNPASMSRLIRRIADRQYFTTDELFESDGLYRSYLCHSMMSASTAEATAGLLNDAIDRSHACITEAAAAIFTFGTACVYTLLETGETVGNCHRQPSRLFNRSMLSVDSATHHIIAITDTLKRLNPEIRLMFTVSPIRHTADGLHGNQLSKATLLLAVDNVIKSDPDRCIYFPSYEILMDDLRDYRFYASDMKHPSDVAVNYIHSIFKASFFNDTTLRVAAEAKKLSLRLNHRSDGPTGESRTKFINETKRLASDLAQKYPALRAVVESKTRML